LPQPWQFIVPDEKKQQFEIVRALLNRPDVDSVTAATDAGREGELIFRFVYQMAGCTKPVKRLWISSMEDAAIREGFANLRPDSDYEALYQSALCRAKADWLVGINATRLFSVLYHKTLTVGRVQTPTLKMLVDRDAKILRFQKEKYYTVGIQSGSLKAGSGRIASMDEADTLRKACAGASAICFSVKREKKTEQPPKLYDLTTLQREANRLFGFTAKQTLDYVQQLYEKKLLTYPRTDSQYLTEDMGHTAQHLVSDLRGLLPFAQGLDLTPEVGRILNSKKVSDHHAIIPTAEFVKQGFAGLAESECKLMNLVCAKLLCAVAVPHEYETVAAVFSCAGNEFTAKGKTVLIPGWKEIDQRFRSTMKADGEEEAESLNTLPELAEGQSFSVTTNVSERFTSPPKAYTEDTLLSAMERAGAEDMPENSERKGLGTPATRAAILEKLVQMGFVQRKGKQLVPTKDGINLAVVLPESLTSPVLTAEWENRLTEIAKGNADADEFMAEIEAQVRQLVKTYSCISADKQNLFQSERVIIGKCPRCSENVYEGKKNFYCGNRSCQFVMWKNDHFFEQRKKAFTPKIAAALLKNGKAKVKGLYSEKTGKIYDATVLLADTGGKYVNYRVERKE
uniref:DNA topoisomerase n=1 Tax=Faecalibacterium sp. TaxID=1971605 RepID=UPI004025DEC8